MEEMDAKRENYRFIYTGGKPEYVDQNKQGSEKMEIIPYLIHHGFFPFLIIVL